MNIKSSYSVVKSVHQMKSLLKTLPTNLQRCCSTAPSVSETVKKRNFLFSQEQKRQYESIGRVEKAKIEVKGPPEDVTLIMNKDISTPYDCALHISQAVVQRSPLALVNSSILWDMHCPLAGDCSLEFLHFKVNDPYLVNKAFWRTCSVVLGAVISDAFKDDIPVVLHSFPSPNVRSGSFVYDVSLQLDNWLPTKDELRILSGAMVKLSQEGHKLERLAVTKELAHEIFEGNKHKQDQIPDIAQKNEDNEVILYRVGNHIDISRGPMVGDTSFIGRCTVASVHQISTESGDFYRFQGVALPRGIMLNHFAYGILENRARRLNQGRFPGSTVGLNEEYEAVSPESSSAAN